MSFSQWWHERRRLLLLAASGLVFLWLLISTYYQVEADEVGVVTRFGRYTETTNPGPHLKLPFGIERVTKVPVQRQLKQEFGFRTTNPGVVSEFDHDDTAEAESLVLTGDLNVATVEWIVQYKVVDPYNYLFRLRNVDATLRDMSEAAVRQVVGDHSVTELLTVGRESMASKAKDLLNELCKQYESGLQVEQLVFQDVDPPPPVRPSFNEVNQAIQERERLINEAWAEYNQEIPRARGQAEQMLQAAEGYAVERVNRAKGDVQKFQALAAEYRKSPEVTRTRLYLEAMSEVLPKVSKKIIVDEKTRGVVPLLNLDGKNP